VTNPPNTVPAIVKPVFIETDGVLGELPTGAIINAGGTSATSFTVDGEPVLLQGSIVGSVASGFEFIQASPILIWNINHGGNTLRAAVTIYDTTNEQIWPQAVQVIDSNNVRVTFNSAQAGVALVILF
jgi:hypothetical protein